MRRRGWGNGGPSSSRIRKYRTRVALLLLRIGRGDQRPDGSGGQVTTHAVLRVTRITLSTKWWAGERQGSTLAKTPFRHHHITRLTELAAAVFLLAAVGASDDEGGGPVPFHKLRIRRRSVPGDLTVRNGPPTHL
ncbi:MAG: hypothetical protein VX633_09975 [Verrucomicrobiota bacterium]|nr:hypothetical protein [Verrucomicrobiota bacterium]